MGAVEGNIEGLSHAILSEARAQAEELKNRAKMQAEAIRQRAEETAAGERAAILAQAREEVRRLRGQETATAQMKARSLELSQREQWLERVFAAASGRLREVPQRKDYGAIAQELVREALAQLKAEAVELRLDKTTQSALSKDALDELSTAAGVTLTVGKPLESGTGVIAQTPDGHLHFDNTLEMRLGRMRGAIRSAVYRVLMGEKE